MFDSFVMHFPCSRPECEQCGYDDLMRFSRSTYRLPWDVYKIPGAGEGACIPPWMLVAFMSTRPRIE